MTAPIVVSRRYVIWMLAVAVVGEASVLVVSFDQRMDRAVHWWASPAAWGAWVPWAGFVALLARPGWRRWVVGTCAFLGSAIAFTTAYLAVQTMVPGLKSRHVVEKSFTPHDTLALTRLSDIDGNAFDLADYGDRPVVLSFWRTWCGPCKKELGDLARLDGRSTAAGVLAVLGLSDEPRDLQREFRAEKGVTFRLIVHDENDPNLQIKAFPTNVVVRSGKVLDVWSGTIPNLAERVVAAAEGHPLPALAPPPPPAAPITAP